MVYEVSLLTLKEYKVWKTGFDELVSILKENGAKCRHIFQDLEDPDKVMVIIEWENMEKIMKLAEDKEMLAKFQKLGIVDVDIRHFEEIENKIL